MNGSPLFAGRLGLAGARVPHVDRHGLLWLSRGKLIVRDGTLHFFTSGSDGMAAGDYAIPYQTVSMILMGPGTTISHDVLRILARHGTLLAAVGEGGVKFYTAPPMGQGRSDVARAHARLWADQDARLRVARRMYAYRFREVLPHRDISALRGIEGARIRESYRILADKYGVDWHGRRYDRQNPEAADLPNQAINHASTFVEAAAEIAVAAVGALPPLGFVHEESSNAFTLDVADLWRVDITVPLAFSVAAKVAQNPQLSLEREVRYEAARWFGKHKLIPAMINRIKELLGADDSNRDS
jgi:CRISPR-associated protein Cas1